MVDDNFVEKGAFIAVLAPNDSFYLCQVSETIKVEEGKMYSITWLEETSKKNSEYILGRKDTISAESIICEINLCKLSRFRFRLNKNGKKFIQNEIKHILDRSLEFDTTKEDLAIPPREAVYIGDHDTSHEKNYQSFSNQLTIDSSPEEEQCFKGSSCDSLIKGDDREVQMEMASNDILTNYSNSATTKKWDCRTYSSESFVDEPVNANNQKDNSEGDSKENVLHQSIRYRCQDSYSDQSLSLDMYADSGSEWLPSEDEGINVGPFNRPLHPTTTVYEQTAPTCVASLTENVGVKGCSTQRDSPTLLGINILQPDYHKTITNESSVGQHNINGDKRKHEKQMRLNTTQKSQNIIFDSSSKTKEDKRIYDKRHACYYCHQYVIKIGRHLELKHPQELHVAKTLAKPKNSKERREHFIQIIRVGDFYHNTEVLASGKGELLLVRRPNENEAEKYKFTAFGPCPYCLGFMLKKHLWLHVKKCKANVTAGRLQENDINKHKSIQMQSNALINCSMFSINPLFRENIIDHLKNDDISVSCKNDILILHFGNMLYEKHGNSQTDLIRQSMRQLGRLKMELITKNKNLTSLKDFIVPQHFDVIVEAVKTLCRVTIGKEGQKMECGIPSLALKLGYSLRKCIGILRGLALRKEDIMYETRLKGFLDILDLEWSTKISSNACAILNKRKMNIAKLVPLTSDLIKLNDYISKEISTQKVLLNTQKSDKQAWHKLAQTVLSRLILFNKRRGGEASRMLLSQYNAKPNWENENTEELLNSLTDFEKKLAKDLKLVQIDGKRGRTVPVLLTKSMALCIELLIDTRDNVGISNDNPYVFARLYTERATHLRGPDCLRTLVDKANLEAPQSVTSTRLRKYVATVCQIFNLKEYEVDWLARHLGHDVRVHREYYRLHESAVELTKVSRLLMTIDEGNAANFAGKSLDQINLNNMPDISEDDSEGENDPPEMLKQPLEASTHSEAMIGNKPQQTTKRKKPGKKIIKDDISISSSEYSAPERPPKRQKCVKRPWTSEEVQAVTSFFQAQIKAKIVPGKKQCTELKEKSATVLANRTWLDIKYYVKNFITKCNKPNSL